MPRFYGRLLACALCVSLAATAQSPSPALPDAAVATGVAQVKRGDHARALMTLEAAVRRLGESKAQASDVALAHLYMGVAYTSLGHALLARDRFREALRLDKRLRLDPDEFPPPVIEAFEEARKRSPARKAAVVGAIAAGAGTLAIIAASSDGGGFSDGPVAAPSGATPAVGPTPTPIPSCTDNIGPQVALTFPVPGTTLSATIVLRAAASDNVGVTELRFFVDERLIGLASSGTSELLWDTRTVSNGNHQLTARAFDACLNQGFSQPVLVVVRN